MYRTHTCGELKITDTEKQVTLAGWVQRVRDLGAMSFIDLRDRYGITQLVVNQDTLPQVVALVKGLGREYVILAKGIVKERAAKNPNISTGDIEVVLTHLEVLSPSALPPFTIEDDTDGGDDLRMKWRFLDLRRNPMRKNLELRHTLNMAAREYLNQMGFIEVETPYLVKSTPEGARDFVVPSRMNQGEFYALPQSPQTFKQILMVAGYDRYYQIVKCFRDEDLRADRQPEFTQIDCEMAFVEQEDILIMFEGLIQHLFRKVKGIEIGNVPRMKYEEAMRLYGSDKPDTRFNMLFSDLTEVASGKGFKVFDEAEAVLAITAPGCAGYTRSQTDALIEFVKRPQIGASGIVFVRYGEDSSIKSTVDKFYSESDVKNWIEHCGAKPGDLILVMSGPLHKTRKALNELRLEMGTRLGLRNPNSYSCLWVFDFPLLEFDEEARRYHAMHHPFTSPKPEDIPLLHTSPGNVRANAYDFVINGMESGGGSIRIHDRALQEKMFSLLGFSKEEAQKQFGFLMNAFEYGAPPHGGIAFGFDRLCALFGGQESIRDFIAFPKNNSGRDVMLDSPSSISDEQLDELGIRLK